jgi:molybdopterin/thiamine biosynthesis adenylyltransferase
MIVVGEDLLDAALRNGGMKRVRLLARPGEGVYSFLGANPDAPTVPGRVYLSTHAASVAFGGGGREPDRVRIEVKGKGKKPRAQGYVRHGKRWDRDEVIVVPVRENLFSRFRGLLETDALSQRKLLIIGLGSGGAPVAVGLVQSGVMQFTLVDYDRLELGNIARHPLGLADVGRHKTKAMADFLRQKNPYAEVRTLEVKIGWNNQDLVKREVERADLVICATDSRQSRLVINKACVKAGKTLIIGGAYRRAYGGQVLRVRPRRSLCYECLLNWMPPATAFDQEISSVEQAQDLAYTDRPVPIEPGLASDIQPISLLMTKLSIQELLAGTPTTLRSLDEDLIAPLYKWFNRREKDEDSEKWKPLEFDIDGMHVLRWYGLAAPRHPACPVCGDYVGEKSKEAGISISQSDLDFFKGDQEEGPANGNHA